MRIIKCGDQEFSVNCNCGCTIAFCEKEVLIDTTELFKNAVGFPLRFIVCPQCHCAINLDTVKVVKL